MGRVPFPVPNGLNIFSKIQKNRRSVRLFLGLEAMQPRFFVHFTAKRVILRDSGRTTPVSLVSRPVGCRSAYQLEQLVGEQGHEAKHEMKPDFRSSPHHHVAGPKPFFQPAIEALRCGPLLVAPRLMGGQGG